MTFDNMDFRDDFLKNPNHRLRKIRPDFKENTVVQLYLSASPKGDLNIICGKYGIEELIEK